MRHCVLDGMLGLAGQSILCLRQRLWFIRFMLMRSSLVLDVDLIVQVWTSASNSYKGREVFWYWLRLIINLSNAMGAPMDEVRSGRLFGAAPRKRVAECDCTDLLGFPGAWVGAGVPTCCAGGQDDDMTPIRSPSRRSLAIVPSDTILKLFQCLFGTEDADGLVDVSQLGPHGYECFEVCRLAPVFWTAPARMHLVLCCVVLCCVVCARLCFHARFVGYVCVRDIRGSLCLSSQTDKPASSGPSTVCWRMRVCRALPLWPLEPLALRRRPQAVSVCPNTASCTSPSTPPARTWWACDGCSP